jgi:hypothetical protein
MAKYINPILVKRTTTGKRYFSTGIPVTPITDFLSEQYIAQEGDRWDQLAYKYLGSPSQWYKLAILNDGVNGSIFIKAGTVIKFPRV